MTLDDEPFEFLTPSASMLPVLTGLRAALVRLGDIKTKSAPRIWDNIDFEGTASLIARFAVAVEGWEGGVYPPCDVNAINDLRHRLSTELEIMSPDDLAERFHAIINGAPHTQRYRRIAEAHTLSELLKDRMALGWSGFEMMRGNLSEQETTRRERMFVDYFRREFDWTRLRALELSEASALLEAALFLEMVDEGDIARLRQRIAGEAIARYASWTAFARALLCARTYLALESGPAAARLQMEADEKCLMPLLAGPWQAAWPRVAT